MIRIRSAVLHVIYRSYGGENKKPRPDYYSKLLALTSFLGSLRQLPPGSAEVIFLNDGPIPQDRLQVMQTSGEILALSGLGLRGSWQRTLALPKERQWADDDLVWLAEDDYLYAPNALSDLMTAAKAFPDVAYFGLYAMVGSRLPNGGQSEDRVPSESRWPDPGSKLVRGHRWCGAISTTSTFGARVKPLLQDRTMMQLASRSGGAWDHTICLMYQGFTPYPLKSLVDTLRDRATMNKSLLHRSAIVAARIALNAYHVGRSLKQSNRRLLISADPALVTHLETEFMALGTDWRAVATRTQQLAQSAFATSTAAQ